jgi:hypothetical protein
MEGTGKSRIASYLFDDVVVDCATLRVQKGGSPREISEKLWLRLTGDEKKRLITFASFLLPFLFPAPRGGSLFYGFATHLFSAYSNLSTGNPLGTDLGMSLRKFSGLAR